MQNPTVIYLLVICLYVCKEGSFKFLLWTAVSNFPGIFQLAEYLMSALCALFSEFELNYYCARLEICELKKPLKITLVGNLFLTHVQKKSLNISLQFS